VGGIHSSAPNIFWQNDGTQSEAYSTVFKVYLTVNNTLSDDQLNALSNNALGLQVYPNPSDGRLNISFHLKAPQEVFLQVTDLNGKILIRESHKMEEVSIGKNELTLRSERLSAGVYILSIRTGAGISAAQRIVLNP
jgi:hypothetical protein